MQFRPTSLAGVVEISIDLQRDARGSFGRTFCRDEFGQHGLETELAQCNISHNPRAGTVRGFHLQAKPHQEAKLIQCVTGRLFDVALDLRAGSPTYGRHHAVELSAAEGLMLYIPRGCAHGFQTLGNDTTILYYVSAAYAPASARGVRWNDPALHVSWPLVEGVIVNERDQAWPLLANYAADP
jgi:dTDP-4-dehydrorhamnose 3,5-epimerase